MIKAVDFFCGIGGVTRGFLNKGIDVIGGIDIDSTCKLPYIENNFRPNGEKVKFFNCSVEDFDTSIINNQVDRNKDTLIVIGCAPCQPFTSITKNLKGRQKDRGLLGQFLIKLNEMNPDYLFIENVEGLKSDKNIEVLNDFIEELKPQYQISINVVNAANYGIPQNRKRLILFGKKNGLIDFPSITHGKNLKPFKTVFDTIKILPPIKAGEKSKFNNEHHSANLKEISFRRLKYQTKPGDGMEKWPIELQLPSRVDKGHQGHKDVYSRMFWNKPSPTLTTKFSSISNGRFAHPIQDRAISILEGLLLQTFPLEYQLFNDSVGLKSRQVGNAVPVRLAEVFAEKIIEDVNSINN